MIDLDELERLHKAATPGEWRTEGLDQGVQLWSGSKYVGETRDYTGDDAASIVALHNAAPALIAEIRQLRADKDAAARERDALRLENERLREALIPSGHTKAAYHGEFIFSVTRFDEDGEEYPERHYVPWTTVKEIMAAIAARAALKETSHTVEGGGHE